MTASDINVTHNSELIHNNLFLFTRFMSNKIIRNKIVKMTSEAKLPTCHNFEENV